MAQIKLEAAGLEPVAMSATWQGDSGAEDFRARMDQASILGVPYVLTEGTWTGMEGTVSAEDAASSEAQFLARMSQIIPQAEENGITILLKPHTGNTATGPLLRATLDKIGSRRVRACYDPGNVHFYEGLSPEVDILHIMPYLSGICVKDHKGARGERNFPVPGDGDVDYRRIMRSMKRHRFAGPLFVEQFDGTDMKESMPVEEVDERAGKAYTFLERIVEQVDQEG